MTWPWGAPESHQALKNRLEWILGGRLEGIRRLPNKMRVVPKSLWDKRNRPGVACLEQFLGHRYQLSPELRDPPNDGRAQVAGTASLTWIGITLAAFPVCPVFPHRSDPGRARGAQRRAASGVAGVVLVAVVGSWLLWALGCCGFWGGRIAV